MTNPQGAVVPGVSVSLIERATRSRFETKSSETGAYTIPLLPPGIYDMAAEAQGFKKYERKDLTVSTNSRLQLDILMEIGSLTETVTVTAETPLVQSATASVGQVITTNQTRAISCSGSSGMRASSRTSPKFSPVPCPRNVCAMETSPKS